MRIRASLAFLIIALCTNYLSAQSNRRSPKSFKRESIKYELVADIPEQSIPWMIRFQTAADNGLFGGIQFVQVLSGLSFDYQYHQKLRFQANAMLGFLKEDQSDQAYQLDLGAYYQFYSNVQSSTHRVLFKEAYSLGLLKLKLKTHYSWEFYGGLSSMGHSLARSFQSDLADLPAGARSDFVDINYNQVHNLEIGIARRVQKRNFLSILEQQRGSTYDKRWILKMQLPLSRTANYLYTAADNSQMVAKQSNLFDEEFRRLGFYFGFEGIWNLTPSQSNLFFGYRIGAGLYPILNETGPYFNLSLFTGWGQNKP